MLPRYPLHHHLLIIPFSLFDGMDIYILISQFSLYSFVDSFISLLKYTHPHRFNCHSLMDFVWLGLSLQDCNRFGWGLKAIVNH